MIDLTFTKGNRLFVLSFENEGDRTSFSKYYVLSFEIKDFNVLIVGKPFFEVPVKNEEAYEQIIKMSRNDDYATGNLLDYEYFSKHYRLIAIDVSKMDFLICIKMETQKIVNLLNGSDNESSKFATRKWYIINDQNNG